MHTSSTTALTSPVTRCQRCFALAPTRAVAFRQNIGALVVRYHSSVEGELCKACVHATFWKMTLTTATIGWFGSISFIVTPIYVVMNTVNYLRAATLTPPTPQQRTPANDPDAIARLRESLDEYAPRLLSGAEPRERVLADFARGANVTTGQARMFWDGITSAR